MRTLKAAVVYWWMAGFRATGKALMAAVMSIAATLNGAEWSQFTPTQKFIGVATALGAMWIVIDAFLDTTMSTLRKESDENEAKQNLLETGIAPAPVPIDTPAP